MSNVLNAMRKIAAKVIPLCPIISQGSSHENSSRRPFSEESAWSLSAKYSREEEDTLSGSLFLLPSHAREEKEVEIACLGVSRLPGEIRSTGKRSE